MDSFILYVLSKKQYRKILFFRAKQLVAYIDLRLELGFWSLKVVFQQVKVTRKLTLSYGTAVGMNHVKAAGQLLPLMQMVSESIDKNATIHYRQG